MSFTEQDNLTWHPFPFPLESDAGQCEWRGGLVGCGPQTAAVLLRFWSARLGLDVPERDALAVALAPQLGAWRVPLSGGARAVKPWTWLLGLNQALVAEEMPLRARGYWGYRLGQGLERRLDHNWTQAWPTVGFEFSLRTQHYGVLDSYAATSTGLQGHLVAPLSDSKTTLQLEPRLGVGGAFWLEPI